MTTVKEILSMNVDELRVAVTDIGQDPKAMTKIAMQEILLHAAESGSPAAAAEGVALVPSFIAKLAPELQLQWWLKQEEASQAERKIQAEKEARAMALEQFRLEAEVKATAFAAAAQLDAEKRDAEAKLEAEKRQAAFVSAKLEADMKAAEFDARRAHELNLKQLEFQAQAQPPAVVHQTFRLDQAIKLLPHFNEQNVEEYLISFEKISDINKWPADRLASILQATLVGKGLKVFSELSLTECQDYECLKKAILNAYTVVSEVHRTRFRRLTKQPNETFSDFA